MATGTAKQMIRWPKIFGVFLALLLLFLVYPAVAQTTSLFGTTESQSTNLTMFKQWNTMLQRDGKSSIAAINAEKKGGVTRNAEWRKFLLDEKTKDQMAQIKDVNAFVNRIPYVTDPVNYGQPDVWNTPVEFFTNDGDCEDYAITKFMSLKQLGVPSESMRIVAVQDLNLKVGHAILVVYVKGQILILDNQIKQVVDAATIKHYKPVFSINEGAWWRHTAPP